MDDTSNPYIQQFIHGRGKGPVTDVSEADISSMDG
jgi:hypothetical protein